MMKGQIIILSAALLMLSCNSLKRTGDIVNDQYTWISHIVDSTMKNNNIPALSIRIVSHGKLVYSRGFGSLNRDKKKKVTGKTIYQIGSDTKKMTAIIAKNLANEGKLSFKESITLYLGTNISDSTKVKLEKITLEYLLTHKAGIPYRTLSNKRIDGEAMLTPYTEANLLNDLNVIQLESIPEIKFSYSNFDYAIAGYICELASNMSYAELIQHYIARPYSMPNTTLILNKKQRALLATPYRKDNRTVATSPWNMGKLAPAGGVYSNVIDQSKLMIEQIKAYRSYDQAKANNIPLILTQDDQEEGGHYGLGLGKSVDEDSVRYGHGGDLDGYASSYLFSPEKNIGLIILTSSGGKWLGQLERTIQKRLFE